MHASKEKNQLNKVKLRKVSFACYLPHIENPLKEKIFLQMFLTFDSFFYFTKINYICQKLQMIWK